MCEEGQWQIRLSFAETMRPTESSVMAIAAAPHHDDDDAVKQIIPTRLQALSYIQRQKKSLMLLKCTVVSTSTLSSKKTKPTPIVSGTNEDCETMFCTETMQNSCFFSTPKTNLLSTTTTGKDVVLKMRQPSSDFNSEGTKMLTMIENDVLASLMPTVHAFVKFEYGGKHWGGMCTDHYKWCINTIIFSGNTTACS